VTDPARAGPRAGEIASRPRVLLFTGKGGVGKTTTAAATALACADRGLRTLAVSTDPAHSLADALGQPLGDRPTPVDGLLLGQQIDARRRLEEQWGELRGFLADILDWAGVRAIEAEELTLLPGLEEILSLTDLVTHAGSGAWDVVVVDCAPTAETLRLLSLPEVLSWWMDRLFPITKQITSLVGPVVRGLTAIPIADEAVFGSVERLYLRLAAVRELLADGDITTVRLVVNPEKVVIAEARRTATYLALFGYRVDAVIVNRLLPDEVTDPWFDHHRAAQVEHLATVEEGFAPVPVLRCPLAEREPVGLELLRPFAQGLYGDLDPSARLHDGDVLDVRRDGGRWVLELMLPFSDRRDVSLVRRGTELIVSVGPYRRALLLPDSLQGRRVLDAAVRAGQLRVVFGERG
jgi:arsenite-transporting ATPase